MLPYFYHEIQLFLTMCPSYLFSGVGTYAILVSGLCSLHCSIIGSHS